MSSSYHHSPVEWQSHYYLLASLLSKGIFHSFYHFFNKWLAPDFMLVHWQSKYFIARCWRDCCEHHLQPHASLVSLEEA